jgi:hypothetical protein
MLVAACLGADRKLPEGSASNSALEIAAKAYLEKDDVKQLLGSDLDGYISVIEVRLTPKAGSKLAVIRDDFLLRSDKDGQRAKPYHPSQIAGSGVLVVSSAGRGGIARDDGGPVWSPPLGGRPRRVGPGNGGTFGNAAGDSQATASTAQGGGDKSLLQVLKEKVLSEEEISKPASGLLYFMLEGKHKPKELELQYKGPAGSLSLRFKG